jgi:cytochrome c553
VRKKLRKWSKQNIAAAPEYDRLPVDGAPRRGVSSDGPGVPPPHRGRFLPNFRASLLLAAIASIFACGGSALAQDGEHAPDTMAARVLACTPCHGDKGQGTNDAYFPRLAGKPAGYLYNQLIAFRDGRRKYPPMNYLLEFLPDAYLKAMADYFASEQPPFPPPAIPDVSAALLARGEALATKGDPAQQIPACANCHGPSFTGMEPAIPGLLGLRTNYISAQLGAWRYGTRTAKEPDCMQIVAGHLTEDDVKALAAWLSSRPMAASPAPVTHGSLPMPLACGSEPN